MDKKINNNMNDFTKKVEEVALYIRVSTEEQAINGDSLRTQREALTKFALANHYHIYGIYEDDGFSATNLNRPALQRLLEDVRKNKINRIKRVYFIDYFFIHKYIPVITSGLYLNPAFL